MKKVGTQVELDLTGVLKLLDKTFVALEKQSKVWDDWLSVVRKALPTLDSVEAMLGKVTGRLNQLKFTSEGATEAGKEEIGIRRRQITVLRAVRDEYKKQARAAEKSSREAERAAKREVKAAGAAAKAQERHTKATSRGLKKMLLWGIGAASAYRLFMKLRRVTEEFVGEVIKGTAEQERMTAVNKQLRAAMAAAFGPDILEAVEYISSAVEGLTGYMTDLAVQMEVNRRIQEIVAESTNAHAQYMILMGGSAEIVAEKTGLNVDIQRLYAEALDAVNGRIDEFNAKADEQAGAYEKIARMAAEARKRTEDYNKTLYQITEQTFANILQAQKTYNDGIIDLELARQRTVEDNAIAAARRLEDIQRDSARRLAALEREYNKQLESAKRDYGKGLRRAAEGLAQKLLDIERRYQDKLLDIERAYARSMYDAISTRDATAALQAMRRRKEGLADAKRDRDRARSDAESDYAKRIRDLAESLAEQERIARKSYEDQLEELRRSLAEQEEDYQISLRRREEDAELSYTRSLNDLKQAFLDRLAAIQTQNALERTNARIDYLLRENAYARHLARMAAIYQSYQTATTPATPSFGVSTPPPIPFAKGGMMVVNQPTLAMFGEAGRELVIAQPLPPTSHAHSITGNVTHQINATISQSIAGMEGRIAGAVQQALTEVIH